MKMSCKVIEDMLPMYYDKICSEESAMLVEEHLKECQHCSHILSELRAEISAPKKNVDDMKPLKKIQKSYRKMKMHWIIAIVVVLLLIPVAFLVGTDQAERKEKSVDFSKEQAIAYANEFMTCLMEKDYAKAYTYWNIEEEKRDLLSGKILTETDLVNFEADGLKKFCDGGEKLESWGGITDVRFVRISEATYSNRYGMEEYLVSYTFRFNGKEEGFGIVLTKYGISHIGSGDGLIRHPLSHLTLWVQWVVDDYMGKYYDFNIGTWVDIDESNGQ